MCIWFWWLWSEGTLDHCLQLRPVGVGGEVGEELAVAGAEVVMAGIAVAVGDEAVLGALAVAGKEEGDTRGTGG